MRTMRLVVKMSAAVAAVVAMTHTAVADLYYYKIDLGLYRQTSLTADAQSENAYAGQIIATPQNGTPGGSLYTVCLDVLGTLYIGKTYSFAAVSFDQDGLTSGGTGINPHWGDGTAAGAAAALQEAAAIYYNNLTPTPTADEWAALQLAVWEALYDTGGEGGLSLTTGRFSATPSTAVSEIAKGYLTTTYTGIYSGTILVPDPENQYGLPAQELFFSSVTKQLGVIPVPESAVPLCGGLVLIGICVCGYFCRRGQVARA